MEKFGGGGEVKRENGVEFILYNYHIYIYNIVLIYIYIYIRS